MCPTQRPPDPVSPDGSRPGSLAAAKRALRDQLLTTRHRLSLAELGAGSASLAEVLLATEEVRRAATVAAYVAIGTEPGTGPLLDGLVAAGKRVILPVLLPDDDLAWAAYEGPRSLAAARRGLLEPVGPRLGVEAVGTADAVLVPGLAADGSGLRLGRGGGSYDRALGRVPVGTFTCVLLWDDEVLPTGVIPGERHDRRVTAAATPSGLHRFPR
ncbi:5-formyltetrahydrofolate cyclo-ligase [Nocardioides sp.]|uniref:5-formyltetrahydrofolate cyclo-ligase n=1 Tax=Nocardioides sp. TaxID=35761 RepID=UPI00273656EF|nr:5-formyltetrahydrofolate cyclo-ligase [Nocardioides sp.]MDP3891730.1 5-formyltetrahydrofolate cyclo-ligase [Nocardioides sp.]